ncbi:MAG: DUF559 domain-containing protein [Propionibacterium sp.]|nr:DUF559 domain-containing protein [Propionibacterium sp.]
MRFFADSPVIAVRDVPHEANALRALRRRGEVWSPLPGIYAHKSIEDGWELRMLAAHLWAPDAVVCGAAAAKLVWWQDLDVSTIDLWGVASKRKQPAPWIHTSSSVVDPDFYRMETTMKIAEPNLSVLQLARSAGGTAIDEALRRGAASLEEMWTALGALPRWRGSRSVRRLLQQSRQKPWSPLERDAHVRLDKARISRWVGNYEVHLQGKRFFIDIAFPGMKIAIEIDGFEFHKDRASFDRDREKQNLLVLAGWTVLRFTSNTIHLLVPQLSALLRDRFRGSERTSDPFWAPEVH